MRQFTLIELEALWVGRSLARFAIDYQDAWNLRQLCKDDLVLVFDAPHDAVCEQVAISLVVFALVQS